MKITGGDVKLTNRQVRDIHGAYICGKRRPAEIAADAGVTTTALLYRFRRLGLAVRARGGAGHAAKRPLICSAPDCDRRATARGLCHAHRWRSKHAPHLAGVPLRERRAGRRCSVSCCDRPHATNGLCHAHDERRRNGLEVERPILPDVPCPLCGRAKAGAPQRKFCSPACSRTAWSTAKLRPGTEQEIYLDQAPARAKVAALVDAGFKVVRRASPGPKEGQVLALRRGHLFIVRWRSPVSDRARAAVMRRQDARAEHETPHRGSSSLSGEHSIAL